MLTSLRKYATSWVAKGLFAFLIVSFAIWGIGDVVSGRIAGSGIAKVGDANIPVETLRQAFNREYERLRQMLGPDIDHERAVAMGLHRSTLDRLIRDELFDQETSDLGLVATDDMVRAEIRGSDAFKNTLGAFDLEIYRLVLQRNGLTETEYLRSVRRGLAREQLSDSLISGVRVPAAVLDPLYRFRYERREADTIFVSFSAARGTDTPDDAVLENFHRERAERFMSPEYRALTVVSFSANDLAKDIAVPEDRLLEAFASRASEFAEPDKRTIRQMVFETQDAAAKALADVRAGRSFEDVARATLKLDAATLELGEVSREEILVELAEPAFALASGQVSEPLQSPLGWHLLQVTAVTPASERTFADVRDQLHRELAREEAIDRIFDLANRLEDSLAGGQTIEEAVGALGLSVMKIAAVDATGRDATGKPVVGLLAGPEILDVAFRTGEGQESALTEAGADSYFMVRVDKVTPSAVRPFVEARADVIEAWRTHQSQIAAREQAEAILARIAGGTEPEEAAVAFAAPHAPSQPFTRDGTGTDLPAALVARLFAATPGDSAIGEGPNGFHVARLRRVIPVEPAASADDLESLRQRTADQMRTDILSTALGELRRKHGVSVDEAMLRDLFPVNTR